MKQLMSALLAAVLLLCAFGTALADETFTNRYFSLTLPEGWIIETEDVDDDPNDDFEILGYVGSPEDVGLVIIAYLTYYEDMKDVSLWNADESGLQEYADVVADDLRDDNPVYLDTVKAGSIPFVLFRAVDEDGDYLYADTMTNGHAIIFLAYVSDLDDENVYPVTDAEIEQFKSILATFQPVT